MGGGAPIESIMALLGSYRAQKRSINSLSATTVS